MKRYTTRLNLLCLLLYVAAFSVWAQNNKPGSFKQATNHFVPSPYPQIIYWKWDETILQGNNLEYKTRDIINRSNFDLIYISFHWVDMPFLTPELVKKIEQCTKILHDAGRKIMIDIDPRNEEDFFKKFPSQASYLAQLVEIDLDKDGNGSIESKNQKASHWANAIYTSAESVVNAWAFELVDETHYKKESLKNIKEFVTIEKWDSLKSKIVVRAGKANAHKKAFLVPVFRHSIHDFFSPQLYEYWTGMFQGISHIPIDGVAIDEWGPDMVVTRLIKNDETTAENWATSFKNENFPYSPNMNALYQKKYSSSLNDDLLYFRYAAVGEDGKRIKVINNYVENLRHKISENESWFYDKGKSTFGKNTFIGAHTTWWCDLTDSYFDTFKNGFNWWEIKRDYGQTDEEVIIPIRLATAHKWGGTVWYNMWTLSNRRVSPPVIRYHTETWNNARYGGRTHHLGYENGRESFPEMIEPGLLEKVAEMEDRIKVLNNFQKSQPDSRVLVLFGMEAITNWQLSDPNRKTWYRRGTAMHETMKLSKNLFEAGYLCDMVPTSEIANGSVRLRNNKISYGTQTYDAVVLLFPDGMEQKVLAFLNDYKKRNANLIVIGESKFFRDGSNATAAFKSFSSGLDTYKTTAGSFEGLNKRLTQWKVPKNTLENGCVYQDGSVIFTANATKNIGNPLKVDAILKGHRVEFEGEDFLAIDIDDNGKVKRYATVGTTKYFKVNGKSVL